MLMFTTVAGTMSSSNAEVEIKSLSKASTEEGYSHNILGEYFTYTTCEPCKYAHQALKNLYAGGYHPFYYITYVYNVNDHAKERKNELNIYASPTVVWDNYRRDVGATSTQSAMNKYNTSIIKCGERIVADIDLSLNVAWLPPGNPSPEDSSTGVFIESELSWTNAEMNIEVTVDNVGTSQYNGHLHVQVTEKNSTMWNDKFGNPYTFEFKDYAFNEDITLTGGGTWSDSTDWDGADHSDGQGNYFTNIAQGNTMVFAAVFDSDNEDYTDETTGVAAGVGTDPKLFDVYFGNVTPPPKVSSNQTSKEWDPPGNLEFNTTYYWQIVAWDKQNNPISGSIWNFTTRGNEPPTEPYSPIPINNEQNVSINTSISWQGGDPDWDPVTYDVYFGPFDPPFKVVSNQTKLSYKPDDVLDFEETYYWKIVAWDKYNYTSSGPIWNFVTEKNDPPYEPSDPYPPDGANDVLLGAILNWTGGDPNPGDVVTYDVYFGRTDPPTKKKSNQTQTSYDPGDLEVHEDYYWKIVAWDSMGLKAEGDRWSFQTGINYPPDRPIITGPTKVKVGEVHAYNFSATDPDGQDIYYYIKWGDGDETGKLGPYPNGTTITLNHSWKPKDVYDIQCQAEDTMGAKSDWAKLRVTVPKNKPYVYSQPSNQHFLNSFFFQILQRLLTTR